MKYYAMQLNKYTIQLKYFTNGNKSIKIELIWYKKKFNNTNELIQKEIEKNIQCKKQIIELK